MSDIQDLYQEVILDHNSKPRNFMRIPDATHDAEGFNPLCGDQVHVYLKVEDGLIRGVSFEGSGCAISKASASMMTTQVKGKTPEEAERLFKAFHGLVTGQGEEPSAESLGKLAVFSGVKKYPARVKCASLAWHALHAALESKNAPVSTE